MIIGLSGKAQSGKDFAAKIIQSIISGVPTSTILEEVKQNPMPTACVPKAHIYHFADLLKLMVADILNCDVKDLNNIEFKNKPLGPEWDIYVPTENSIQEFLNSEPVTLVKTKMTPRMMLQKLGTNVAREIHPDIWVNELMARYDKAFKKSTWTAPLWIIADVRFPNEVSAIMKRHGYLIRLFNDNNSSIENHPSEVALDDYTFDWDISWTTPESLVKALENFLIEKRIIK